VMIGNVKALDLFTNSRPTQHDVTAFILRDEKEMGDIKRRGRQERGRAPIPVVALKSVEISSAALRARHYSTLER
jgi:hypothetical protein